MAAALPPGGITNLERFTLGDVAIPKADIRAVPHDVDFETLLRKFKDTGFSRLPVYKNTLDNPLGFVHLKDMVNRYWGSSAKKGFVLKKPMLRRMIFAPPSMTVGTLLQTMQKDRVYIALMIDEHGGVDGLVTLEDLIETVIGNIEDEHDVAEAAQWKRESKSVLVCRAKMLIDDFETETGIDLMKGHDEEEIDTLGGLVSKLAGTVPVKGQIVPHPNGLEFEVTEADPRRVKIVKVDLSRHKRLPADAA